MDRNVPFLLVFTGIGKEDMSGIKLVIQEYRLILYAADSVFNYYSAKRLFRIW